MRKLKMCEVRSCDIAETTMRGNGIATLRENVEKCRLIAEMLTRGDSNAIWQENVELKIAIAITAILSRWQLNEEFLAVMDVQISVNGKWCYSFMINTIYI